MKTECNLSIKKGTLRPVARNDEGRLKEHLIWVQERSKTDMSFLQNCVFIDESGFNINMRPSYAWSARGTPAIVTTPSTKTVSHTVLGAISAMGIIDMELRVPSPSKKRKVARGSKRKASEPRKPASKGTTTGHYLNFILKTLDQMDKHPDSG